MQASLASNREDGLHWLSTRTEASSLLRPSLFVSSNQEQINQLKVLHNQEFSCVIKLKSETKLSIDSN